MSDDERIKTDTAGVKNPQTRSGVLTNCLHLDQQRASSVWEARHQSTCAGSMLLDSGSSSTLESERLFLFIHKSSGIRFPQELTANQSLGFSPLFGGWDGQKRLQTFPGASPLLVKYILLLR